MKSSNEIKAVIKCFQTQKSPGQDKFTTEFYQTLKEELTPKLLNYSTKHKRKHDLQIHSIKPVLP
jgi:hypothetical protein